MQQYWTRKKVFQIENRVMPIDGNIALAAQLMIENTRAAHPDLENMWWSVNTLDKARYGIHEEGYIRITVRDIHKLNPWVVVFLGTLFLAFLWFLFP
jgi:hypothetical protein